MTMTIRRRTSAPIQSNGYIIACAWCGRVRRGAIWRRRRHQPPGHNVSHGICPDCFSRQIARLDSK